MVSLADAAEDPPFPQALTDTISRALPTMTGKKQRTRPLTVQVRLAQSRGAEQERLADCKRGMATRGDGNTTNRVEPAVRIGTSTPVNGRFTLPELGGYLNWLSIGGPPGVRRLPVGGDDEATARRAESTVGTRVAAVESFYRYQADVHGVAVADRLYRAARRYRPAATCRPWSILAVALSVS